VHEADHLPLSIAEVKECLELYLPSQYVFMAWCLVKHREKTLPFFTRAPERIPEQKDKWHENGPSQDVSRNCNTNPLVVQMNS